MQIRRARVLVVDNPRRSLSQALAPALTRHEVDVAADAFDAIYRIDCEGEPHDVIFCDMASDFPGPELWAYLRLGRLAAAERVVFVASGPLDAEAMDFLDRVPNPCIVLPAETAALDAIVRRHAWRATVARGSNEWSRAAAG